MNEHNEAMIAAVAAAADTTPTVALLLHLASLYEQAGQATQALVAAQRALQLAPTDVDALEHAARHADAAGVPDLADGYRQLRQLLAPSPPEPTRPPAQAPALSPDPPRSAMPVGVSDPLWVDFERTPASGIVEPAAVPAPGHVPGQAQRLADVAGLDDVKTELERRFLGPIRHPELVSRYGKRVHGGLLLFGPPGCGKTFLATAIAAEIGVDLISVSLADYLGGYLGDSERRLHHLFEQARSAAPCVVFLDEVDAMAHRRSNLNGSAMRNAVTQLLTEMDGSTPNDGVCVIGATNVPWDIDPAVLRPGRFDTMILVPPPDSQARASIITSMLQHAPNDIDDITLVVERTRMFSGADISFVVERAVDDALAEAIRTGRTEPVTTARLLAAVGETKSSVGPWIETAKTVARHGDSAYASALRAWLLKHRL